MNRRLAEHRNRKAPASGPRVVTASHRSASRIGAEAAARVAERFAHAPSYSQMLSEETRYTPLATAPDPPAADNPLAAYGQPSWQAQPETTLAHAAEPRVSEEPIPVAHRGEPRAEAQLFAGSAGELLRPAAEPWRGCESADEMQTEEVEPIHGNLIEFPREVVAARRIRPRLAEGPYAAARDAQLSIFEVDPEMVSAEAEPVEASVTQEWSGPEWSGIKLDAQPEESVAEIADPTAEVLAEIELAPLARRLLAHFVDATLISAAVLVAGAVFAANATALPEPRTMGMAAIAAFVVAAVLYELLFSTLAQATPGMKYAHIVLRTFSNANPTREQRWRRLRGLGVSLLPVGLGLLWALFDEQNLCWHDRFSQTYLKNSF